MKIHRDKSDAEILRQKAEGLLNVSSSVSVSSESGLPVIENELRKLIHELAFQNDEKEKRAYELSIAIANSLKLTHELQVHQIELEMQNEELLSSRAALQDAAEKYTELYDLAPTGYFTLAKDGMIVELNFSAASMLGKESLLLKNTLFGFFVSGETKPIFWDFLHKTFHGNTIETCDVTLSIKGVSPVYVHLSGVVKKNREHCLVTMVNITRRKIAEASLLQSDAKHSSMISNISDVIGIIGVDCLIKYKSPNIEKLFGWKPHDLVGTDGWLTVHSGDLERIQKEFCAILEKDNSATKVEYRYRCKDGSYKPIELTATNLINDPVINGVLLNYHDISDRIQIEEKLKLESSRLLLATRTGGVGVWDYDVVNNVLVWDDEMYRLYGINKKDFQGVYQAWQDGVHPDDRKRGDEEIQMAIRGEKEFDTEFRVSWPDGSVHIIRAITIVHRDDSGKALRMIGTNWDITELRKSEKVKLDDSENRYRSVFEGSSDGIVITDMETKMILFANPALCKMFGYTEPQLQTMNIEAFHLKGTFKDTLAEFNKMASAEKTHVENIQCIRHSGEIFYVDIVSSITTINGNKCLAGFFRDITQRKQAEDMLHQSEEMLKTIVYNSSDLTTFTDATGHLLFISPQIETVLGYQSEKFIGIQIPDIIHPDDVDMVRLAWSGIFNYGNEVRELEYRIADEHGATRWVSHSAKIVKVNSTVVGVQSTIRNITGRKMAEETIKVSEEKYKTMLNASPDCMVLTDMAGVIIEISEIGLHLFGAGSRDDLMGKDIFQFVPSDEHSLLREMRVRTIQEGLTQNVAVTIKKQNQSLFAGEISATLMQGADGAPLSLMFILRDISLRKKKEAKQIHTDRMSTLGEMAAGIAHEINQPLNIISMVMDRILFEIAKPEMVDYGFLRKKSDKIFENITRIRDIIDHVRAFSRSHDDGYIPTPFSVNSSIVNASSMITAQFNHYGINLNLQLEQQMSQLVGNTYKFEQVILNLLANAKDAVTEKKSKSAEDFEMLVGIRTYEENRRIFVDITDNGIGISNDDLKNIMLPFYTTKEEGKGTGLGLSISYQIIREMNGTIEVTSDISNGTKFQLVLPVLKTT